MQDLQDNALLSPAAAAALLGVSTQRLSEYVKDGSLRVAQTTPGGAKKPGQRRYTLGDIKDFLSERNATAGGVAFDASFDAEEPNISDVGRQFAAIQARQAAMSVYGDDDDDDEDTAGDEQAGIPTQPPQPIRGGLPTVSSFPCVIKKED